MGAETIVITPTLWYYWDMARNNIGQYKKVRPEDRFWDKVKKTKSCWIWIGKKRKDGYGVLSINGKEVRVHRFVMRQFNPAIKVLHKCDNPSCVNPNHLFIGTQLDNIKDMYKKNRGSIYFTGKGENNPNAKLTNDQVRDIRNKYIPFKYGTRKLAIEYKMAQQTIWKIVKGQRYVNA
jgi:hypothetical protein